MSARRTSHAIVRNVLRWDFLASVLLAAVFLALVIGSDRPLNEASGPIGAGISLGIALALGAAVAGRWLGDSVKDDAYGEVIRALDPRGRHAQLPYKTVSMVGLATALWGGFLLIAGDELGRTQAAWAYAAEVFLASYGLLGMLDLLLLGYRHQARQASLRALREEEQRRRET